MLSFPTISFSWEKGCGVITTSANQQTREYSQVCFGSVHSSVSPMLPPPPAPHTSTHSHFPIFSPAVQDLTESIYSFIVIFDLIGLSLYFPQLNSHVSWPMTLNKEVLWTMNWTNLPVWLSDTSVKTVERKSMKQHSTTPLNSLSQCQTWQRPCVKT